LIKKPVLETRMWANPPCAAMKASVIQTILCVSRAGLKARHGPEPVSRNESRQIAPPTSTAFHKTSCGGSPRSRTTKTIASCKGIVAYHSEEGCGENVAAGTSMSLSDFETLLFEILFVLG